ncbi:MAG TPA: PAS domain S-box protein [Holophagaceae bacterium]
MTFRGRESAPGSTPPDPQADLLARMSRLAKVGGWSFDPRTGDGEWTEEVARIHDLDPDQPTSRERGLSFYTPESRPLIERALQEALEAGRPYDLELELVSAKGVRKWVRTQGHPVVEQGRVVRIQGTFQDITERKRAELALRESEDRLRLFIEHAPAALAMFDRNMRYLAVSRRWLADYGLAGQEVLGRSHYEVFPEITEAWKAVHRRGLAGEVVLTEEDRFERQDGSVQWLRWEVRPWYEAQRSVGGIVIFTEDITERMQALHDLRASEAALRESEQLFALAFSENPAAIVLSRLADGVLLDVNATWETLTGYRREEVLGRSVRDLGIWPSAEAAGRFTQELSKTGVVRGWEQAFQRKDGTTFVTQLAAQVLSLKGVPIILSTVVDITARKRDQEEIHRLNADLEWRVEARTAELRAANAELEAFAYAVSHDLRAPLRAMSGFSLALEEDFGASLPEEARGYLAQIRMGSERMGELIDGLLALSRTTRGDLERRPVNLSDLAEEVRAQLERAEPGRQVRWRIQPGLRADGDPRMLRIALANLLGNAWKYSSGCADAEISLEAVEEVGEPFFCVADNGAGFDMAHTAKLFQPFQRLHRQDEFPGLGIGLATVQRIIHRHGGRILAKAEPGRGAAFRFSLPEHPAEESP